MEALTAGKRLENHDLARALHLAFVKAQERIGADCLKYSSILTKDDRLLVQQRLAALRAEREGLARVEKVRSPLQELDEITMLAIPNVKAVAESQKALAAKLLELAAPAGSHDIPVPLRERLQEQEINRQEEAEEAVRQVPRRGPHAPRCDLPAPWPAPHAITSRATGGWLLKFRMSMPQCPHPAGFWAIPRSPH